MKNVHLRMAKLNERWSNKVIKEYYKCKDQITDMFRERYLKVTHNSGYYVSAEKIKEGKTIKTYNKTKAKIE